MDLDIVNPFLGRTLPDLVEERARTRGDATFLVWDPDRGADPVAALRWSYAEWAARVRALAAALGARGIGRGDFVCVHLDNHPAFLLAWWALARLGAVCVSTNTRSVADELSFYLENSSSIAVITEAAHRDVVADSIGDAITRVVFLEDDADPIAGVITERLSTIEAEGRDLDDPPPCPAGPLDPCCVQYTSGTTSRPKGVVLTHANYLWGGQHMALHQGLRSDDVHLVQAPLFHINAQVYSVLSSVVAGGTIVLLPRFSRSGFWPVAIGHGATVASMIPFFANALLGLERGAGEGHRMRLWGYGFSWPKALARFGLERILGWYGMTETITAPIVTPLHGEHPPLLGIGRPSTGYEIRVVDPDGEAVPVGEPGALRVRGVPGISLAAGYLANPEATAAAFLPGGWLDTGDRIRVTPEGWAFFVDRAKDMIKVGGENVAASEVERVVFEVPGLVEVAVVGVRDPMYDQVPAACVIPAPGVDPAELETAILARCREKLADFKVPRRVEVLPAFPRSTLEKVNKAALRERLEKAGTGS